MSLDVTSRFPMKQTACSRRATSERRWSNVTFYVGIGILVAAALTAIFAPLIAPYDPNAIDLESRLLPPSVEHAMGTDTFGRDIASRVIYAIQLDLRVIFLITYVPLVIGILGRRVRRLLRRLARLARHAARRRCHRPPVPRARDRDRRDRRRRADRRLHRRADGRMGPVCAAHAGRDARAAGAGLHARGPRPRLLDRRGSSSGTRCRICCGRTSSSRRPTSSSTSSSSRASRTWAWACRRRPPSSARWSRRGRTCSCRRGGSRRFPDSSSSCWERASA